MKIELELKISDSVGGWKDGMVIGAKPLGVTWTVAQIRNLLDNDIPPPGFNLLPLERQETIIRRFKQVKWLLEKGRTVADLIEKRPTLDEKAAQSYLDEAAQLLDRIRDHGFDINYGFEERKSFGVVIVDIPYETIEDVLGEGTDLAEHPFAERKRLGRRRYRVPYETLLSQDTVDKFRDKAQTIVINRGVTPLGLAGLLELAR